MGDHCVRGLRIIVTQTCGCVGFGVEMKKQTQNHYQDIQEQ